ncbi:unnamed protein product [Brassica rapa subsp. trilocularis]
MLTCNSLNSPLSFFHYQYKPETYLLLLLCLCELETALIMELPGASSFLGGIAANLKLLSRILAGLEWAKTELGFSLYNPLVGSRFK